MRRARWRTRHLWKAGPDSAGDRPFHSSPGEGVWPAQPMQPKCPGQQRLPGSACLCEYFLSAAGIKSVLCSGVGKPLWLS